MNSQTEKFREASTLLSLLAGLTNHIVTVEQLNENKITGNIDFVDPFMNVQMSNATIKDIHNKVTTYELLQIRGNRIRFVILPDNINIIDIIKKRIDFSKNNLEYAKKENARISKEASLINKGRIEKRSVSLETIEANKKVKRKLNKANLNDKYKDQKSLLMEQMKKDKKKK